MNTLKGHGQHYYKTQCDRIINIAVEATENQQYSKPYLARLRDEYEQNKLVVLAYNILNVIK